MHLDLVPVLLHLSLVSVETLLVFADIWMVPHVGLLFLLPLNGVLLGPVLVHFSWVNAAPPDVKLVFTQLTLQAPLLGVGTTNVVLEVVLSECLVGAALPGAGVASFRVDNLHVPLPVTSLPKTLVTKFTFKSPDLVMN